MWKEKSSVTTSVAELATTTDTNVHVAVLSYASPSWPWPSQISRPLAQCARLARGQPACGFGRARAQLEPAVPFLGGSGMGGRAIAHSGVELGGAGAFPVPANKSEGNQPGLE